MNTRSPLYLRRLALPLFPTHPAARRLALGFTILAPLLYGLLSLAMGQDANWDLRNYHWYNAFAFLNNRLDFDILPAQTPTFYNPTMDLPFYLLATRFPARLVGFLLGMVQGLNGVLLFALAYRLLRLENPLYRTLAAIAIAIVGLLGGGTLAELGTTFYDNVISLGIFRRAAGGGGPSRIADCRTAPRRFSPRRPGWVAGGMRRRAEATGAALCRRVGTGAVCAAHAVAAAVWAGLLVRHRRACGDRAVLRPLDHPSGAGLRQPDVPLFQ